jgi:hypothetical protein
MIRGIFQDVWLQSADRQMLLALGILASANNPKPVQHYLQLSTYASPSFLIMQDNLLECDVVQLACASRSHAVAFARISSFQLRGCRAARS